MSYTRSCPWLCAFPHSCTAALTACAPTSVVSGVLVAKVRRVLLLPLSLPHVYSSLFVPPPHSGVRCAGQGWAACFRLTAFFLALSLSLTLTLTLAFILGLTLTFTLARLILPCAPPCHSGVECAGCRGWLYVLQTTPYFFSCTFLTLFLSYP